MPASSTRSYEPRDSRRRWNGTTGDTANLSPTRVAPMFEGNRREVGFAPFEMGAHDAGSGVAASAAIRGRNQRGGRPFRPPQPLDRR